MVVLILAIVSFLIFLAIVVLLLIADTLESRTIRDKAKIAPANPPPLLSIAEAFDPILSVVWEAPIAALTLVDSAGASGVPAARLRAIYAKATARFPEIYDGWGFVDWLRFLQDIHLVSWNGPRLVITPEGQAFLRFRFVTDAMVEA